MTLVERLFTFASGSSNLTSVEHGQEIAVVQRDYAALSARQVEDSERHINEVRESLKKLVGIKGPLHKVELANLRIPYEKTTGELEMLRGERDALQSLLQKSLIGRVSETAAIKRCTVQPLKLPLDKSY